MRKGKGRWWTHPLHLVALWTIKVSLCREALGGEVGKYTQADKPKNRRLVRACGWA